MTRRPPRVPPTLAPATLKLWHWPCGCVARDSRGGPIVERCDGTACVYNPTRPAGTRTYRA